MGASLLSFWRKVGAIGAGLFLGETLEAGSPTLLHIWPAGGQRGTEVEVICEGTHLEDARGLVFYNGGMEVVGVSEAVAGRFKARIRIAADAPLGEQIVRPWTATGLGDARTFYVTPYPLVKDLDRGTKEAPKKDEEQAISMGTTVWGTLQGEETDRFVIEAKKGDRIAAEMVGVRLQTKEIFDAMLTLKDAEGKILAECDDSSLLVQDPVISVIAPADGKYHLSIRDSTNSAPLSGRYLLTVGKFPRPLVVYPAGGASGEVLSANYLGDGGGRMAATFKLPATPSSRYGVFPEESGLSAPSPNWLRVSPFANVLEVEPNNQQAGATSVEVGLPVALNGVIGAPGDIDYFKILAKKGEEFDCHVFARWLRSPLDAVLEIYDEKGSRLQQNDDSGGPDSYLRWKVPADGSYGVAIRDQQGRGGETFVYRVEIAPVRKEVGIWLPEMEQNTQDRQTIAVPKGNRYASMVKLKRDGVMGELVLTAEGLPMGVTMEAVGVESGAESVAVVFEAKGEAVASAGTFVLGVKSVDGQVVGSRVAHPIDLVGYGNNQSYYRVTADRLAIGVMEEAPFKIQLIAPKVPIAQGGSLDLKVVAERKSEFKGKIKLALLSVPTGIGTAGGAEIKESESEGVLALSAQGDAPVKKWKILVVGSADLGKGAVWVSTQLVDLEVVAPFVGGQIVRGVVDQGEKTFLTVHLSQKTAFSGKAKIELRGLPNKVTAEPREISKDDTEVRFEIQAEKTSPVARHTSLFCQVTVMQNGEAIVQSFGQGGILRIDPIPAVKLEEKK